MGELNCSEGNLESTAPRPAKKREEVGCELLLISAPPGGTTWWIKGARLVQMDSGSLAAHGGLGLEAEQL